MACKFSSIFSSLINDCLSNYRVQNVAIADLENVKIDYGGLVLGSSQFLLLPQLLQKMMLASKMVKIDSKIIISRRKSKSVTHSVQNSMV